eukprot:GILI01006321.1.p1 GENE.GILI01006321.1~~GILI01006321.1.p1  ORF type:complete len:644 (-),score=270.29 GILI01006321.1:147-2021(-)
MRAAFRSVSRAVSSALVSPASVAFTAQTRSFVSASAAASSPVSRILVGGFATVALGSSIFLLQQRRAMSEAAKATGKTILVTAAELAALNEGESMEVTIEGDKKLLLIRSKGELYAVGSKCTHFGAPLSKGVVSGNTVLCPWHDAGFNIKTGRATLAPGISGIPTYRIHKNADGSINIEVPAEVLFSVDPVVKGRNPNNNTTYVIVGAGPAGLAAAETLRTEGFDGRIVLVSSENSCPYDRTMLSKAPEKPLAQTTLRDQSFFDKFGIEFMGGQEVTSVDTSGKQVVLANGQALSYDAVLVATGGAARRLPVPGMNLKNVYTVRKAEDAQNVVAVAASAKKVVIIGSSFIGMETAAAIKRLSKGAVEVHVIGKEAVPFTRVFGERIGLTFQRLAESQGVVFHLGRDVKEVAGSDAASAVVLDDGTRIEADAVFVGAGIVPATSFLKGVPLRRDGSVAVDPFLKAKPNVYAAGDIATFPYWLTGEQVRVEHWNVAQQHGRVAAKNMLGGNVRYSDVPFFWSMMFGKGIRYAGYASGFDDVIYHGDVEAQKFVAYYVKDSKVVAVASMQSDPAAVLAAEALKLGIMPDPEDLRSNKENMDTIAKKLKEHNAARGCCGGGCGPKKTA